MKLIPLTKGYFAQVDDDDFKSINQHKWFVQINHYKSRSVYYAARSIKNDNGKPGMLFMHQVILGGKKDGFVSDHIDFDGLNNRRSNLRYLTHRDNLIHSPSRTKPFIEKKPSVRQPYILQIKVDRKWHSLMLFKSAKKINGYCIANLRIPVIKNAIEYSTKKYGFLVISPDYRVVREGIELKSKNYNGDVIELFEEEFKRFLRGETNFNPRINKVQIPLKYEAR